jgi:hypothetical protein
VEAAVVAGAGAAEVRAARFLAEVVAEDFPAAARIAVIT